MERGIKVGLSNNQVRYLEGIIHRYKDEVGPLMPVLHEVQKTFGCISHESQKFISNELKISLSEIYGVVTFYSQFTVEPSGKYSIGVCMGTACYVKGAERISDEVSNILDIKLGETTKDGLFTLTPARCLGDCSKAPAMMIGDELYGNLTIDEIKNILQGYKE